MAEADGLPPIFVPVVMVVAGALNCGVMIETTTSIHEEAVLLSGDIGAKTVRGGFLMKGVGATQHTSGDVVELFHILLTSSNVEVPMMQLMDV